MKDQSLYTIFHLCHSHSEVNTTFQRLVCSDLTIDSGDAPTTDLDISVAHTKTTLVGTSLSVPITGGNLNLGTWQGTPLIWYCLSGLNPNLVIGQGIYLTEFRHVAHSRRVVATILWVSSSNREPANLADSFGSSPDHRCCHWWALCQIQTTGAINYISSSNVPMYEIAYWAVFDAF